MKTQVLFTCLTCTASLLAQTTTMTAVTPLLATAQHGTQSQSTSQPSGPLPGQNLLAATLSAPTTSASLWSSVHSSPGSLGFDVSLGCTSAAGGSASLAPGELMVTMSSPFPVTANLTFQRELSGSSGAGIPTLTVDVQDNGSIDYSMTTIGNALLPITLGPTPIPIRVRIAAGTTGSASLGARVLVIATPTATTASTVFPGCAPVDYAIAPRFDGNLDYVASSATPVGVVFGLTVQPVQLGSSPAGPCLGLPRPDIVLLLPSSTTGTLSIPPAARPLRLWSQAVSAFGPLVGTSSAWSVFLN